MLACPTVVSQLPGLDQLIQQVVLTLFIGRQASKSPEKSHSLSPSPLSSLCFPCMHEDKVASQVVKNLSTCQCRRHGFKPWVGKTSGEGNGNSLQYPCLGNPMDRGAWWITVHEVAKESEMTEWINNSKWGQEERGDWHKATQRIHRSGLKPGGSDTIWRYSAPVVTHVARHNALFYLTIHSVSIKKKSQTHIECQTLLGVGENADRSKPPLS